LIARDDLVALGAIQALRQAGVEVPRQMSVTGFDNLDLARWLHPTLTTIDQSPLRLMERAGEMLLADIARPAKSRGAGITEAIAPEFIQGESTAPAWRA
jgi:LacI family transcriptional regulator